jgi:hypothetical protein
MAARFSDQLAHHLLAVAIATDQLAIGVSLFDRTEIFALYILD